MRAPDERDASAAPREWNAAEYHRLAGPQFAWGMKVLERIAFRGDECVLDAGCGSGRLTVELLARVPDGCATGADLSETMVRHCAEILSGMRARASCVRADLLALPFRRAGFDVVFSTATFHWVLDHARLFSELSRVLVRRGRLEAQCGGGANLRHTKQLAVAVARSPAFAGHFAEWAEPWYYAGVAESEQRLRAADFIDVECWLEEAPVTFDDAETFRDFLRTVVLRPWLARLADPEARRRFVDDVTEAASRTSSSLTLDYQRLNIRAARA